MEKGNAEKGLQFMKHLIKSKIIAAQAQNIESSQTDGRAGSQAGRQSYVSTIERKMLSIIHKF